MPDDSDKPQSHQVARSFWRARRVSLASAEGYSVGLILLGYLLVGYFAGGWLDRRFHTDYWLPILIVAAMVEGFRQVFLMVRRMAAQDRRDRNQAAANRPRSDAGSSGWKAADIENRAESVGDAEGEGEDVIPRFKVPPPPIPEFEKRRERRDEK